MQKGDLSNIFTKYLKEEENPNNQKKTEVFESKVGEDILHDFNDYLYKKYNCEAFNKSSFIIYKNKNVENNQNFSTLLSINEDAASNNNNERVNTLNSNGTNDMIKENATLNKNRSSYNPLKTLSPFQSNMGPNRSSMNDSNMKNQNYFANDPKNSRNPSKLLTKLNKNLSKKEESQKSLSD